MAGLLFKKFPITLPPGNFRLSCRLENTPEKAASFRLRVKEGNYPRKVKLPEKSPVVVDLLTESGPVLLTQYVDILAADGCRLRSLEGVSRVGRRRTSGEYEALAFQEDEGLRASRSLGQPSLKFVLLGAKFRRNASQKRFR